MKVYNRVDPEVLEPHYSKHVRAMTAEGLHDKGDIAAELAFRDRLIADLMAERDQLREQINDCMAEVFGE